MNTIDIENEYVYNTYQKIKIEIYKQQNIMMSDDDLLLFLMTNNTHIDISKAKED